MSREKGFTLVELLVVVAVIGVLVGLLLPAVQAVRQSAERTECSSNLRQIALAVQGFQSSHRHFPVGIYPPDHAVFPSMSWLTQILPYIEQDNVWHQAKRDFRENLSPFTPHAGLQTVIPIYECPSNPGAGSPQFTHENRLVALTSYPGVNGTNYLTRDGIFYQESRTRPAEITDGLSHTLMAGERPPSSDRWYGWWYAGLGQDASGSPDMLLGVREVNDGANYATQCAAGPYHFRGGQQDEPCATFHFWSRHPGGANFALADGSVQFLDYQADEIMPQLATIAGSEIAGVRPP